MKVVILAGGFGTRISEESQYRPKPMVEIGGRPILWHIMKIYSHFGFNEFIICAGYRQHMIKEYFADYFLHTSDITFDFTGGKDDVIVHHNSSEPWTGGRIKRIQKYVDNASFMLTYGDGVSDVNIDKLVKFHKAHGKIATLTAVNVGQRFGVLGINNSDVITSFREKKDNDGASINGGFMVLEPEVFDYIDGDDTVFEQKPLEKMAEEGELMAFHHDGFWQCMDTQRDKMQLEEMWEAGKAPWKLW